MFQVQPTSSVFPPMALDLGSPFSLLYRSAPLPYGRSMSTAPNYSLCCQTGITHLQNAAVTGLQTAAITSSLAIFRTSRICGLCESLRDSCTGILQPHTN